MTEEYEIIPVSPLRRLEKRIEKLETFSGEDPKTIFREVIDIIRMNQQIVDELVKSNDSLKIELAKIPGKMEELLVELRELISFVKASAEVETTGLSSDALKPVIERLDALVSSNKSFIEKNEGMLEVLDEISRRLKRSTPLLGQTLPQIPGRPVLPLRQPPPQPQPSYKVYKKV